MRLSRQQLRETDRRSIEEFGIPGIVLMENAARSAPDCALEMIGDMAGQRILILCGGGNNGGDGLALARHLVNRGMQVQIGLSIDPARYRGDALINWNIAQAMRIPARPASVALIGAQPWALVVDAIFGTGLSEAPRDPFPALADAVNAMGRPVLAIDIPSGLDCDSGEPLGACIRASRTISFVAEKLGFLNPVSRPYTGEIRIGDIGCPQSLPGEA